VKFEGDGSGTEATASLGIVEVKISPGKGGSGYTDGAPIKFEGDGSGAEATIKVDGKGAVNSIVIISGKRGSGYTKPPTVKFDGGGTGAEATAVLGVVKVDVTSGKQGSGYTKPPLVKFDGDGSGAEAIASLGIVKVTVASDKKRGSGYTKPPTVKFEGDGTGAEATASLGVVDVKIASDKGGAGYTKQPTVKFEGDGSGTEAKAILDTMVAGTRDRGVSTSSGSDPSTAIGAIPGRVGSPSEPVVRQIGLMHKNYLDKDDLGTLLDACITASDLLEEPTPKKIQVAMTGAVTYQLAVDAFLQKSSEKTNGLTMEQSTLNQLSAKKDEAEKEYLKKLANISLSPLGAYCMADALPKIVQVYQERESAQNDKLRLCKAAVDASNHDPSWTSMAQQCVSTVFK
jgi:hypothetical protein